MRTDINGTLQLGHSDIRSECPSELRQIMRLNSAAIEQLTRTARDSDSHRQPEETGSEKTDATAQAQ
jgi:hypothetical protein